MNNDEKDKPIVSPFVQPTLPADPLERDFILKLTDLCNEYHHHQFFIAFECEAPKDKTMKTWKAYSNGISKFMVESLEHITKSMRLVWDNQSKK